jgi:LmbE family N-acetylglucosaminyl deacetylase
MSDHQRRASAQRTAPGAPLRALFIHAHFDDFEFTGLATFELWRRRLGSAFRGKLIVCTDGEAGHHFRSREETGRVRLAEQLQSVGVAQLEFEQLVLPSTGRPPREACMQVNSDLLAALWKTIRDFEPDYLFCPPLPTDNLVGVHIDHITVAEAIRKVAYMINVPHAFTAEYPGDGGEAKQCKVPVILTVHDGYMFGAGSFDLAVNVEPALDVVVDCSWCHQSQVCEWLPWVDGGREAPQNKEEWRGVLKGLAAKLKRQIGLPDHFPTAQIFTVTAWGTVPPLSQLEADLPNLITPSAVRDKLAARLALWRGESASSVTNKRGWLGSPRDAHQPSPAASSDMAAGDGEHKRARE